MSLRRIGVLLGKELKRGPRNFMFIFALAVPVAISLLVSLLFGSVFSGKPRLGVSDAGDSELVTLAQATSALAVTEYATTVDLRAAAGAGAIDIGVALPADFDERLRTAEPTEIGAFVWGQSLLKDRAVLGTTIASLMREVAGQEPPVEIVSVTLEGEESIPWAERLVPFIVLMAVIIGGSMVPATLLVEEKQKRTFSALVSTPVTVAEVFSVKGLIGWLLAVIMGIVTLVLNQAFGAQPLLLVGVLALGAMLAAVFGVLLGAYLKDINTLFATVKAIGLVLYAPAVVYLFPQIPEWIARIFPTYYIIAPIVEISQRGGTLADVGLDLVILVALIVVLIAAAGAVAGRVQTREALA